MLTSYERGDIAGLERASALWPVTAQMRLRPVHAGVTSLAMLELTVARDPYEVDVVSSLANVYDTVGRKDEAARLRTYLRRIYVYRGRQ